MKGKKLFALGVLALAFNQVVYASDDNAVVDQNNNYGCFNYSPKFKFREGVADR